MDPKDYYRRAAKEFVKGSIGADLGTLYAPFLASLPKGARILDAGCGSGRDSRIFSELGYDVSAFDASPEMVKLASEHTGLPIAHRGFDDVDEVAVYDGIWACASLLHVAQVDLPNVFQALERALKPSGMLYASFKEGSGSRTDAKGRYFTDFSPDQLQALVGEATGLELQRMWRSSDVREARQNTIWVNGLWRRC